MNINRILNILDFESVKASNEPDMRRVLAQEANTLRAAVLRGPADHISAAIREAERTLRLWGVDL